MRQGSWQWWSWCSSRGFVGWVMGLSSICFCCWDCAWYQLRCCGNVANCLLCQTCVSWRCDRMFLGGTSWGLPHPVASTERDSMRNAQWPSLLDNLYAWNLPSNKIKAWQIHKLVRIKADVSLNSGRLGFETSCSNTPTTGRPAPIHMSSGWPFLVREFPCTMLWIHKSPSFRENTPRHWRRHSGMRSHEIEF